MDENKKKTSGLKVFIIVMVLLFIYIAISSNNNTDNTENYEATNTTDSYDTSTTEDTTASDLELLDHSGMFDSYSSHVTGTIRNNSDHSYDYVEVEVNLYDADGNQIDTSMDNTTNLEAGGTWKFDAVGLEGRFTTYKIMSIEGW